MADETEEEMLGCCADKWAVWLRFETWIWAVFLFVQVTMVVFLVIHGRSDKSFRQAFYVFFVVVTFIDCFLIVLRPSSLEYDQTIFGTFYDYPMIAWIDPRTNETDYYPATRAYVNGVVLHIIVPVFAHAQSLFLFAVAVNRFTALCFPLKHAALWSSRRVSLVVITLTSVAVLLGSGLPVVTLIRQHVVCSSANEKESETLSCYRTWAFTQWILPLALINSTSAVCCMGNFTLNVGSITILVVFRLTGRLQQRGPEVRLFVQSLCMFLLQVFLAFHDVVYIGANQYNILEELGIEFAWSPVLAAANAWDRFRIGELRLREDPEFTVRALAQCLLALSGSIFLLAISGNVRDAYFMFFFGCVRRKQTEHNSVNVIQVTAIGRATA